MSTVPLAQGEVRGDGAHDALECGGVGALVPGVVRGWVGGPDLGARDGPCLAAQERGDQSLGAYVRPIPRRVRSDEGDAEERARRGTGRACRAGARYFGGSWRSGNPRLHGEPVVSRAGLCRFPSQPLQPGADAAARRREGGGGDVARVLAAGPRSNRGPLFRDAELHRPAHRDPRGSGAVAPLEDAQYARGTGLQQDRAPASGYGGPRVLRAHSGAGAAHGHDVRARPGGPARGSLSTILYTGKGGVIMDVVNAEQARIAEEAGAVAVMALERVPADIRAQGGVARMSDPEKIVEIQEAVTIPVMAKARIGHFVEAQVLEALEVDYVDESEVLTPADEAYHIDKAVFEVPFVCGATNLGEALRRIGEGGAMIRSKGEAGTGNVVEAVRHMRAIIGGIRRLTVMDDAQLATAAKEHQAPLDLVRQVARDGKLPVVLFTAGGIATPADAALMMQLGADGVFVGSGIFKSGDPEKRAAAIVKATTHFKDAKAIAEASKGLGEAMVGKEMGDLAEGERLATRGW